MYLVFPLPFCSALSMLFPFPYLLPSPHVCEILLAPFELAAACGPISPCCRIHTLPKPLFFSLVRRMIAMLINCVAEKTNAHSDYIWSVAFSPDGTKIVSGSGRDQARVGTIKVWDLGAPSPQIAPPWPKLTPAGLSGRQTGAVEREDERPQRPSLLGRVFPGRIEACVRIIRRDDQSMGFWCAQDLKSPLLGEN